MGEDSQGAGMKIRHNAILRCILVAGALGFAAGAGCAQKQAASACQKIMLAGEINAGQTWQTSLGQSWVFRIQPIQSAMPGDYSGWDLVVDRDPPAGYPDALLLATLPYNSINEREIGTTFGLRAQDAIGWNPRTFHFLTDPAAFRQAQQIYLSLFRAGQLSGSAAKNPDSTRGIATLMSLEKNTASGEFRIQDAHLTPGIADAAHFAEAWALAGARTPHEVVAAPNGKSSARGSLAWMRFSVTLWLPKSWRVPAELHPTPSACVP
jgi:hypothetical protein